MASKTSGKTFNKPATFKLGMETKAPCILPILLLFAALLATISTLPAASANFGTFQQWQPVHLEQTCDNGISTCTQCNLSYVKAPNSTVLLAGDVVMSKVASRFNYTFLTTEALGTYQVAGYCTDGTSLRNWVYSFTITPGAPAENNTSIFLLLGISAVIFLILAILMHNHVISFFSGLLFLSAGVYSLIFGFSSITNIYTQMLSIVLIGLGAITTIVSAFEFATESSGEGSGSFLSGLFSSGGSDDDFD